MNQDADSKAGDAPQTPPEGPQPASGFRPDQVRDASGGGTEGKEAELSVEAAAEPPDVDGPPSESSAPHPLSGRFLFNINFVFLATLVSNTVGFGVAILLARSLGPDGRGALALYHAAVNIGFAFVNLGIASAAFYFLARKEISDRQAMEAGLSVSLLSAAVAAAGVGVTAAFFGEEVAEKHIPYALAILTVPAIIQLRMTSALLRARGRFGAMNVLDLALPLSLLACLGAIELAEGLTVPGAVWGWSLAFVPPTMLGYALLGPSAWPRALASMSLLAKTIRFGFQGQLQTLISLANTRLDTFMILIFVNTAGVGIYTVANSQTEGLWILADSVAIVLLTNITAGDEANRVRMTPVVCRNTLLVTGVAAIVAAVIAGFWIPVVFGADYRASVLPYLWLLPGTVALSGAKILASYVFARGRPIINAGIALANLAVTTPITIGFILLFGVTGAAAATSLGYVLTLAMTAYAYHRLSGNPINEALIPRRDDIQLYLDFVRSAWRKARHLPSISRR